MSKMILNNDIKMRDSQAETSSSLSLPHAALGKWTRSRVNYDAYLICRAVIQVDARCRS